MRIVIKDADFSAVSIGKVIEDLSFTFLPSSFVNYLSDTTPNFTAVTYFVGSSTSENLSTATNANRGISDFIKVIPGMQIKFEGTWSNTSTTPSIVAFDGNKNVLPPSKCGWTTESSSFIVQQGVAFIKLQSSGVTGECVGTMPA